MTNTYKDYYNTISEYLRQWLIKSLLELKLDKQQVLKYIDSISEPINNTADNLVLFQELISNRQIGAEPEQLKDNLIQELSPVAFTSILRLITIYTDLKVMKLESGEIVNNALLISRNPSSENMNLDDTEFNYRLIGYLELLNTLDDLERYINTFYWDLTVVFVPESIIEKFRLIKSFNLFKEYRNILAFWGYFLIFDKRFKLISLNKILALLVTIFNNLTNNLSLDDKLLQVELIKDFFKDNLDINLNKNIPTNNKLLNNIDIIVENSLNRRVFDLIIIQTVDVSSSIFSQYVYNSKYLADINYSDISRDYSLTTEYLIDYFLSKDIR